MLRVCDEFSLFGCKALYRISIIPVFEIRSTCSTSTFLYCFFVCQKCLWIIWLPMIHLISCIVIVKNLAGSSKNLIFFAHCPIEGLWGVNKPISSFLNNSYRHSFSIFFFYFVFFSLYYIFLSKEDNFFWVKVLSCLPVIFQKFLLWPCFFFISFDLQRTRGT